MFSVEDFIRPYPFFNWDIIRAVGEHINQLQSVKCEQLKGMPFDTVQYVKQLVEEMRKKMQEDLREDIREEMEQLREGLVNSSVASSPSLTPFKRRRQDMSSSTPKRSK